MHPFLSRLDVEQQVQDFFEPFYRSDDVGNLLFDYGDGLEHYGFAFHKVPLSQNFWMAGSRNFSQVRSVILCTSAMEAVSWLKNKQTAFGSFNGLLLLSVGAAVREEHGHWLSKYLRNKQFRLVFGRDLLGRMADVKLAAAIRGWPLEIYHDNESITVNFRSRVFSFGQYSFSLNSFEKAAGYRFGIPCDKPKGYDNFFDLLKASAFPTPNNL
jgi:hypothetical protein